MQFHSHSLLIAIVNFRPPCTYNSLAFSVQFTHVLFMGTNPSFSYIYICIRNNYNDYKTAQTSFRDIFCLL